MEGSFVSHACNSHFIMYALLSHFLFTVLLLPQLAFSHIVMYSYVSLYSSLCIFNLYKYYLGSRRFLTFTQYPILILQQYSVPHEYLPHFTWPFPNVVSNVPLLQTSFSMFLMDRSEVLFGKYTRD